jgi:hypothetical protein
MHAARPSADGQQLDLQEVYRLPQDLLETTLYRGGPGEGGTAIPGPANEYFAVWTERTYKAVSEADRAHKQPKLYPGLEGSVVRELILPEPTYGWPTVRYDIPRGPRE